MCTKRSYYSKVHNIERTIPFYNIPNSKSSCRYIDSISHHTYLYDDADHGVFQQSARLPAAENNILCCPFPAVWPFGDSDYLPRV